MKKLLRPIGLFLAWTVGGVIGLALLAVAVLFAAKPTETARFFGAFAGQRTGHMQLAAGTPEQPLPKATLEQSRLSLESLEAALAYGAETRSDALIVWRRGHIQLERYYPGADESTLTSTQSMHKSTVALLTGVAIAEGHISSVDDPVSRYLPEWGVDERASITLRHLLWQSSGVEELFSYCVNRPVSLWKFTSIFEFEVNLIR